jgi:hypothetical protein
MADSLGEQAQKLRQRAEEYRIHAENCRYADARAAYEALARSCDELAARLAKYATQERK